MITDGRSLSDGSIITSDLCIIGAGPAGIALALEFLGTGVEVVLLESGGLKWNEKKQNLADFEIEGPPYFVPKETRVRALGGTSNAWGGVCTPYDPVDFEERPWVANSGWPIAFNDLSPFYVRALRLSAAEDGPQTDNTGDDSSNEIVWSELNFSTSSRFGIRYRASIRNAANIRCLLNSTVTELISHPETRKITEVSVASRPARRFSVKAQVYVLACGGIENARLLLASNGTSPNGVGNEHDAVGRYFMEHPRIKDNFAIRKSSSILAATFPGVVGKTGFSRVQLSDSIQREEKLLNYHANISLGFVGQDSLQWEALRRIAFAIRKPENPYFPSGDGGPNRLRLKDIATTMARPDRTLASAVSSVFSPRSMQRWVEVVSTVEQPPLPHNRVVLSSQRDEYGSPKARVTWSFSDLEKHTYKRGLELTVGRLKRMEPNIRGLEPNLDVSWRDRVLGTWHHMGTTRMHNDPRMGVVDSNNRVHSVENLYVAGSSVFTTGGSHAPTLTLLALTLRLADHLKITQGLT